MMVLLLEVPLYLAPSVVHTSSLGNVKHQIFLLELPLTHSHTHTQHKPTTNTHTHTHNTTNTHTQNTHTTHIQGSTVVGVY